MPTSRSSMDGIEGDETAVVRRGSGAGVEDGDYDGIHFEDIDASPVKVIARVRVRGGRAKD